MFTTAVRASPEPAYCRDAYPPSRQPPRDTRTITSQQPHSPRHQEYSTITIPLLYNLYYM